MRLRWEGVFRAPRLDMILDSIAKPDCLLGVKFVIPVGFVELVLLAGGWMSFSLPRDATWHATGPEFTSLNGA